MIRQIGVRQYSMPAHDPMRRNMHEAETLARLAHPARIRSVQSDGAENPANSQGPRMSLFERWLSLWVAFGILAGLVLGNLRPGVFAVLADLEYASVNLVVAVLIWAMVYPMMIAIDFTSLKEVGQRPKGLMITLVINWLVKPFTMAALAVLFFDHLFAGLIDPAKASEYIAGLILLGAAPCTAMVFVWSQLTKGDANYTLVQVSVNDLIMVVAFAPIVAFLLGVTDIEVPWETLILSVVLYIVIPLIAGALTRRALVARGRSVEAFTARIKPASVLGLLLTVVLLFGFQGPVIIAQPLLIGLIAVPIIIQSYGIFALGYAWAFAWKLPHKVAAPCALIGTSNFFELAVAVAIGLFGLDSGAALATVVGVLVEVPVMLSLVAFSNRTRSRFTT
jgi:ACR3 family arsenite transporter